MNTKKLKILLLSDAVSFHTERFYNELQKQNCEVLLASLEKGIPESFSLERKGFIKPLYYWRAVPQIRSIVENFKPDIISAHFASGYGHIAALACKGTNVPLALNLWGSDILIVPKKSIFHKFKTKYALKKADYIFADSQYLINAALKIHQFNNYAVIPWGVENYLFDYFKQDFKFSNRVKIIVPRLQEKVYNNLFIVQSLQELIRTDKIQLTFPAFGSLYGLFEKECHALVGDKIKFYQKADRKDFLKLASQHDVYLSASLSDSSPVSLIEAMALGLVPIVLNIDGVKEWISDENGFLFEHNKVSLVNTVNKVINSQNDFDCLRENNKKKVNQEAMFEKNISDQIEIFKSLIKRSNEED